MAAPLLSLLLLSVTFSRVYTYPSSSYCDRVDVFVEEKEKTIKTERAGYKRAEITTWLYVKPFKGFQGVNLRVEDESGTSHLAFFPLNPDDRCLPQDGKWGQMKIRVIINRYHLFFYLNYGGCFQGCTYTRTINQNRHLRSLTVKGHGNSHWRRGWPDDSCVKRISSPSVSKIPTCRKSFQETQPSRISTTQTTRTPHPPTTPLSRSTTSTTTFTATSSTMQPTTIPTPNPSTSPTTHEATGTPDTLVVGSVVGVVMAVTIVVVIVVVVWRMRRRGSSSLDMIRLISQPAMSLRRSHVTLNSLYGRFSNFSIRQ